MALFNEHKHRYPRPNRKEKRHPWSFAYLLEQMKSFLIGIFMPKKQGKPPRDVGITVDEQGMVSPDWKGRLEQQFRQLQKNVRQVQVTEFGAVGDGKTDCTKAFQRAIGNGKVKVIIPAGTYIVKGLQLPSWTWLVGEGKGKTILKLHPGASKSSWVVTNSDHKKGNHHLFVEEMSLDWHVERLGEVEKTSVGGNRASCLTYANVTYGWVKNVEAINPGLHCFDVSSTLYNYSGDGYRARGGSKYIWLDGLNGYGFGDDGITTHHSDYIWISNSHMCDPSGKAHKQGYSNSNGIEVDDGSQNVLLVNNSTARCFGGVEVKAHHNSSAATNVHIVGHLSMNDNRSFNFRHIGHHQKQDPESKTAYNITASRIVAIAPVRTDLYRDSHPRALVVSAYKNVVINQFRVIGDPEYDYQNQPVIAVQYRSRNVLLNHVNIQGFQTAGSDIKIFGGEQRADDVQIRRIYMKNSAANALTVGPDIQRILIHHVIALHVNGVCGCHLASPNVDMKNITATGYKDVYTKR
nr:glycosyl hydrolase family 28-related protein [Bacillus sp. FJAT-42315]